MRTRKLGWTNLELTTVGLGTWAMGGGDWSFAWGPQDDELSVKTIHRALDLGINWIDTAPAYGLGHCEEVVGRAIRGLQNRPMIATKCGRSWNTTRQLYPNLKADVVRAEIDASLKRLQVDVIDLYQIHWPQPDEDIEEAWQVIASAVHAGKIRFAGVSNFNAEQLKRLEPIHPVASLQPPYSMLARGIESELLRYCASKGMGVIVYSPMQKGLLTGKVTTDWIQGLPEDDHRKRDPQFQSPLLQANLQLVAELEKIAQQHGRTVAELAIAWVLRRSEITSAIVGGRKPSQVEETSPAADWELDAETVRLIDDLLEKRAAASAA